MYIHSNLRGERVVTSTTNTTPWHATTPLQRKSEIACLLRYEIVLLVVADAQDPWASADALNAGSGVLQRPLQNISCTAPDAW